MIRKAVLILLISLFGLPVVAQKATEPADPPPQTVTSATLTLDDLVREALQKNPAVQSALHAVQGQRLRVPQARSWPEPTLALGWMGNIAPFDVQAGDPSSYRSVSAMQEIPYPGKLRLRGEVASKEAQVAWWDYEALRRQVAAGVKTAYYDYFFYDKALQVTRRDKELLGKLASIAEARYRVGKGIQQDVLRSQVEVSLLLQKVTTLEQQRDTAQARLNSFLARAPESPLPAPAEVQAAALQSLDALYALARSNDTGLQREQQMVERNQLAADLARKDYYPDLSVGYMYQQRPLMPDMHGLTFSLKIPVFYKSRQRAAVQEAAEQVVSAQQGREERRNELYFQLKQEYLAAKASSELVKLYSQGVVPQSSLALESAMSAYQVGTVDFLSVLANFRNLLDYETDYYRELANYQSALARMEPLVGQDLTSAQSTAPGVKP